MAETSENLRLFTRVPLIRILYCPLSPLQLVDSDEQPITTDPFQ
eukprot:COSAG03_NODE_1713_length_3611_cov_114.287016_4_plen_44_part_00